MFELLLMIILVTIGLVMLIMDHRTEWTKFIVCICILGGVACLASYLTNYTNDMINRGTSFTDTTKILLWVYSFCIQLSEHYLIFFFSAYSISYSRLFVRRLKTIISMVCFVIITICFISLPVMTNEAKTQTGFYTEYYQRLTIFGIPLMAFGVAILIISYILEKNPRLKKERIINLIIALPIALSISINLLIGRSLGLPNGTEFNFLTMFITLTILVFLAFRHGAIGVRLRLEHQNINSYLESIANGTAIFNHTLKNEVGKISLSTVNIKHLFKMSNPSIEDIMYNIDILENSSNYLRKVIRRLKDFSDEIRLQESSCFCKDLIENAIENNKPFLDSKNIAIISKYNYEVEVKLDPCLIQEVISNIIKNACEAIDQNGKIAISLFGTPKTVFISISDNGPGIKKSHLNKIFEPFFSTKQESKENYGLGLSYCYRVMQKHNCDINVYSKENHGTSIILGFPYFRLLKIDSNLPERGTY